MEPYIQYSGPDGIVDAQNIANFEDIREVINRDGKIDRTHFKFVVIVKTTPNAFDRRSAYRDMFSKLPQFKEHRAAFRFYIGVRRNVDFERLRHEITQHRDVVMFSTHDNYLVLSRKTFAMLDYASARLSSRFILMIDDDAYVSLDHIEQLVDRLPDGHYYIGTQSHGQPIRQQGDPCYMPSAVFPGTYPMFVPTPCCLLSTNLVRRFFERTPTDYFRIDDVAIGMEVERVAVSGTHIHSFEPDGWDIAFDATRRAADIPRILHVVHPLSVDELRWLYDKCPHGLDPAAFRDLTAAFPHQCGSRT